jgi:hypothetical protein
MTTKTRARRPFIGEWHIVEMEQWDREDLDLLGPAYLTLDRRGQGTMRFVALEAGVDYRPGVRDGLPAVEFSFDGNDEGDRISGRGWAVLTAGTLRGRVFLHDGDESTFSATRRIVRRGARSARQRRH